MDSEPSFLGTGWGFPPSFAKGGSDVGMVSGTEDIHQSLRILLSTQPGERILQDDFGCDLNSVLFEETGQGLANTITGLISDAFLYHESRVRLDGIDVRESGTEQGLLLIRIDYTVPATNSRFNMVYPFYINEASMPGRA
jgi:phage baseplate assembly protein W